MRFQTILTSLLLGLSLSAAAEIARPRPATSADRVRFTTNSPLTFEVEVSSLEQLVETGEVAPDLRLYRQFAGDDELSFLREGLQRRFPLSVVQTHRLSHSPLGRDTLRQLGRIVRLAPDINGFYGLRAAINGAAAAAGPEGFTLLDVIRQFPTERIEVDLFAALRTRQMYAKYLDYNAIAVEAIAEQSAARAAAAPVDGATLPVLFEPGPYSFTKGTIEVENPALRQTAARLSVNYSFEVDIYVPDDLDAPAPIVVISHGFGALKDNFVFMAEHLASHGFVAIVPDHVGSDLAYRQSYLAGKVNTLLSPVEFVDRPQEISFLIDELEALVATDAEWRSRLDVEQIGVMGDSFGAITVLSLAGAEIDFQRLSAVCDLDGRLLNFSLYLQCRARYLPRTAYDLKDPRIGAAIAAHAIGYGLFGPQQLAEVDIPVMMVSGSQDFVAPVIADQIHPFAWLGSPQKYLALLQPGTHFSTKPEGAEGAGGIPAILLGEHAEVGQRYYKTLVTAFFDTYLRDEPDSERYLTAGYAESISQQQPMQLDLIRELSVDDLIAAYGSDPPVYLGGTEVAPETVAETVTESTIADIEANGVLRVALRRDAPPFGFINNDDKWTGYCIELAELLRDRLQDTLDIEAELQLAELPSSLGDRYALVADKTVHLECGPNSIRTDLETVAFSQPIYGSGTRLLARRDRLSTSEINQTLAGRAIGVLSDSTTESFVSERYPEAEVVTFTGVGGRQEAIAAVRSGDIDAFASDSVLTAAELAREGVADSSLELVPQLPLTCDYYALILPANDPEWRETVNRFLAMPAAETLRDRWLLGTQDAPLDDLNYCLNR